MWNLPLGVLPFYTPEGRFARGLVGRLVNSEISRLRGPLRGGPKILVLANRVCRRKPRSFDTIALAAPGPLAQDDGVVSGRPLDARDPVSAPASRRCALFHIRYLRDTPYQGESHVRLRLPDIVGPDSCPVSIALDCLQWAGSPGGQRPSVVSGRPGRRIGGWSVGTGGHCGQRMGGWRTRAWPQVPPLRCGKGAAVGKGLRAHGPKGLHCFSPSGLGQGGAAAKKRQRAFFARKAHPPYLAALTNPRHLAWLARPMSSRSRCKRSFLTDGRVLLGREPDPQVTNDVPRPVENWGGVWQAGTGGQCSLGDH